MVLLELCLAGLGYPEVSDLEGDLGGCVCGFDDYVDAFEQVARFYGPCLVYVCGYVERVVGPFVHVDLVCFVFDDVWALVDCVAAVVDVARGVVLCVGCVVYV